ncbi:MAG: ABC transporter permease [Chloroflexota bacterium]
MTTYILSQFRGRPWRSLAVMAGVALGATLFVALSTLGAAFQEAARRPLQGVAADLVVTRPLSTTQPATPGQSARGARLPFGMAALSADEVEAIRRTEGVGAITSALQVWDFGGNRYTTILGLDPAETSVGPAAALNKDLIAGRTLRPGERGAAVSDLHFARFFKLEPGSTVDIDGMPFQVVGIVEMREGSQASAANVYVNLADAQELVGLGEGQVDQVYVRLGSAGDVDAVVARLNERLGPVSALTEDSLLQVMGGISQVSARFSTVAAAVGLLGGLLLAWIALGGLVAERQQEIGLMKAVGWSGGTVGRVFLREALLLSALGGIVGVLLGLGAAWLLGQVPLPELADPAGQTMAGMAAVAPVATQLTLSVQPSLATLALALLAAIGGGTLAGWSGARRAAQMKPAQALRAR